MAGEKQTLIRWGPYMDDQYKYIGKVFDDMLVEER